jgi:hypothetical protein
VNIFVRTDIVSAAPNAGDPNADAIRNARASQTSSVANAKRQPLWPVLLIALGLGASLIWCAFLAWLAWISTPWN